MSIKEILLKYFSTEEEEYYDLEGCGLDDFDVFRKMPGEYKTFTTKKVTPISIISNAIVYIAYFAFAVATVYSWFVVYSLVDAGYIPTGDPWVGLFGIWGIMTIGTIILIFAVFILYKLNNWIIYSENE